MSRDPDKPTPAEPPHDGGATPSTADGHWTGSVLGAASNLANQLTALRLGLALVLFALLSACAEFDDAEARRLLNIGFGVFLLAGVTDLLDGWVARRLGLESSLGRMLDPFVDKVLICGAIMLLAGVAFTREGRSLTGLQPWMAVVVMAREILVTGIRSVAESRGTAFGADGGGKLKMVLQSVLVGWLMFALANFRESGHDGRLYGWAYATGAVLIAATMGATIYSGLVYVNRARLLLAGR